MRDLNEKQKKFLDKIMVKREINDIKDLTREEYSDLEDMNDHETIYQNIKAYIDDKWFEG